MVECRGLVHCAPAAPGIIRPASTCRWGCFASIQLAEERGIRAWVLRQSVALRTRWRHMPYGDQALFVQRSLFWRALLCFVAVALSSVSATRFM